MVENKPKKKATSARPKRESRIEPQINQAQDLCPLLQVVKTLIPELNIKTTEVKDKKSECPEQQMQTLKVPKFMAKRG